MSKLKVCTDENVDVRVAEGLRMRGVEAFSIIERQTTGVADMEHFKYAAKKKAVIFTHDHHFLEIARELIKQGNIHYGVVFVEMNKLSVGECIKRLNLYANILSAEEMINQIEFL